MKKLTREQIKIIYISAVVVVFLLIFWLFVYGPQSRRLASIKRELANSEAQIAQITNLIGEKELIQAVKEYKIELNSLTSKLPSREEDVIYNLSEQARDLGIEVRNIIPSQKQLVDSGVEGYNIEELPISMNLSCEFQKIGEYLNILRDKFPVLVRVWQLNITTRGAGQVILDVSLQISAYLTR